jgi:hypothetical protein
VGRFISSGDVPAGIALEIEGLQNTQYVLQQIDPELSGKLKARLLRAVNEMAGTARTYTTALGLVSDGKGGRSVLAEDMPDAVSSIVVKKARGRGYQIRQESPTGAIVEFAANYKTPQGKALGDMLSRKFGEPGRFIWQAADDKREETYLALQEAVATTIAEANAKLGRTVL